MKPKFVIGLTGSIGMGKSTTAEMFRAEGVPVWSADEAVHRLYESGGLATKYVEKLCPEAVSNEGVNRSVLSDWIARDPENLSLLEKVIHPLVADDRRMFLENSDADIVLLDVPLLFETSAERLVDATVVVTTSPDEQRRRVLARQGMTEEKLQLILDKQIPDAEKRARADYIIETKTLEDAQRSVQEILKEVRSRLKHA